MSMKHIGTKILAGVLVVLLAGAGVLIWRNLPEDAPRLQEPEETVRQEAEVQPGHHSDPVRGGRYCGAHAACRGCVERRSV